MALVCMFTQFSSWESAHCVLLLQRFLLLTGLFLCHCITMSVKELVVKSYERGAIISHTSICKLIGIAVELFMLPFRTESRTTLHCGAKLTVGSKLLNLLQAHEVSYSSQYKCPTLTTGQGNGKGCGFIK